MNKYQRQAPTVQAGSMADIAFLLLIFFLVSTKMPNDNGLARKLPAKCRTGDCIADIKEKNILGISLNANDEILVTDKIIKLSELKNIVKEFVDNNGDKTCNYCDGMSINGSSDNPNKAVISLSTNRETSYLHFINVQNKITNAYFELRSAYSKKVFKKNISKLNTEEITEAKKAYPFILSEATLK